MTQGYAFGALTVNYLSSIPTGNGDPVRIAADNAGTLYVAAPASGKILKYSQDGSAIGSINGFVRPISVAVDSSERVYVGDFQGRSVNVVSSDGQALFSLGKGAGEFGMPGGIAIAANGSVYVTDSLNNVVKVYGPDGAYQFSFGGYGTGAGQMIFPTGIASDNTNQEIYVVDYTNGRVEVFSLNGTFNRSFGSYGSGQGKLTRPQGIHVSGGKVYVADAFQSAVEVFDTNGTFLSFAGQFGTGQGSLKIPMDVTTIGTTLFVSNTDNQRIEVFDIVDPQGLSISPSALSFAASVNNNPAGQALQINPEVAGSTPAWTAAVSSPFTMQLSSVAGTSPSTVTVNVDTAGLSPGSYAGNVIFTANGIDYPIAVSLALAQPQQLFVSPGGITLTYQDGILSPQKLVVNSSSGVLSWSAATNLPWLTLLPAAGTTPGSITAALNDKVNALSDGTYNGVITVAAPNTAGSPATVPVTLTVVRQKLLASPAGIDLSHQVNGELAARSLSVGSSSGSLDWTATGDAQWFTLSALSGATPGSITISLNANADSLAEGTHNGAVTLTAPNAVNGSVTVPVTLNVAMAGSIIVNTDRDEASFTITGATASGTVTYTGSGKNWMTDSAKPATYSIRFDHVKGYRRPASRSFEVKSGKAVALDVQYQPVEVANIIVAAKGSGPNTNTHVRVVDLMGNPVSEFKAFTKRNGGNTKYGAKVATADIDGDGTSEIIVTQGPGEDNQAAIKVFRYDGTLLSSIGPIDDTQYGANVAVGDILGNGQHEAAMSMSTAGSDLQTIVIYQFSGYNLVEKARLSISNKSDYPADIAFGDVNGDGVLELIVSAQGGISIYGFNETLIPTLLTTGTVTLPGGKLTTYKSQMTVSAGDIAGDGFDDIILGYDDGTDSYVGFFDDSLKPLGPALKTFVKTRSAPTLSSMDSGGDGTAEILAGKGPRRENDTTVRVYDASGTLLKEIRVFDASVKFGVNAVFGVKK